MVVLKYNCKPGFNHGEKPKLYLYGDNRRLMPIKIEDYRTAVDEIRMDYESGRSYRLAMKETDFESRRLLRRAISNLEMYLEGTPEYIKKIPYSMIANVDLSVRTHEMANKLNVDGRLLRRAIEGYGLSTKRDLEDAGLRYEDVVAMLENADLTNETYIGFIRKHKIRRDSLPIVLRAMSNTGLRFRSGNPRVLETPYADVVRWYLVDGLTPSQINALHHPSTGAYEVIYRYGLTSPSQRGSEYHDKMVSAMVDRQQSTFLERYGETSPCKTPEIRRKIANTNTKKYGAITPFLVDEARSKAKAVYNARYDADNPSKSPLVMDKIMKSMGKKNSMSAPEQMIASILSDLDVENIILHDHSILGNGEELDFVLPDYKVAIECSPAFTHNSNLTRTQVVKTMIGHEKSMHYHRSKHDICKSAGYRLLTIYDMALRNETLLRSVLAGSLGKSNRIDISKIRFIDSNKTAFLKTNWIDGRFDGVLNDESIYRTALLADETIVFSYALTTDSYDTVLSISTDCSYSMEDIAGLIINDVKDRLRKTGKILLQIDDSIEDARPFINVGFSEGRPLSPRLFMVKHKGDDCSMEDPTIIVRRELGLDMTDSMKARETLERHLIMPGKHGWFSVYDCGRTVLSIDL